MTGDELTSIRKRLGLTRYEMGRAFGYEGNQNTIYTSIKRYEAGDRDIPPWLARLAWMYDMHGVPQDWLS